MTKSYGPMAIDPDKALQWAQRNRPPKLEYLVALLGSWRHQVAPRLIGHKPTIGKFIVICLRAVVVLGIASSVFWIEYAKNKTIDFEAAWVFVVLLAVFMFVLWTIDRVLAHKKQKRVRRDHDRALARRHYSALRDMTAFMTVRPDAGTTGYMEKFIEALLNCIDHTTRSFLTHYEDLYFETSLLLFLDRTGDKLRIEARAHPYRARGATVSGPDSAAYYVAKAKRDWKAIHDLKTDKIFPNKGLSKSDEPPYRSILLIPIICPLNDGTGDICKGVVSVDAEKPYEFWGAIGSDLTEQILPYVQLINLLVSETEYGMSV